MSEFDKLFNAIGVTEQDMKRFHREASEVGAQLEERLNAEMQAEADARLELEAERVERVREWERCREVVKLRRENLRQCLCEMRGLETLGEAHALLAALDELERLEERGV